MSLCAVSWCYILPIVVRVLGKRKGKRGAGFYGGGW